MPAAGEEFERLVSIMKALRAGCPWDREQTPASLKPYIIEEAYEAIEAIDGADPQKIKEELGDLLFQAVFQAALAEEKGEFDIAEVLRSTADKMVSRHPHVFGQMRLETPEEVVEKWQEHKRREGKLAESVLEGIPASLPALLRARKVQQRASRVGFDWAKAEDVIEKLREELGEFESAVRQESENLDQMEEELGDILFSIVNVSRFLKINPEEALRKTTAKFIQRFNYIEKKAAKRGKRIEEMTLKEMDELWEEAKGKEK